MSKIFSLDSSVFNNEIIYKNRTGGDAFARLYRLFR